jgi:hypothetical protein
MDFSDAVAQIWDALAAIMVVSPLWAGVWLVAALVLAVLMVFAWPRLFGS